MGKFNKIVDMVIARSPFQKKKLLQYLATRDEGFFEEAEVFAATYDGYLEVQNIPLDYAVSAYLEMCANMMKCQIEFMKTGKYTVDTHDRAYEEVYSNETKMKSYMIGLAISQFLWPTHYEMFRCFSSAVQRYSSNVRSYLEIGPGHGLFLNRALETLPEDAVVTAVDISPVSISITRSIMNHFRPKCSNVNYSTCDILKFEGSTRYDFITMGEVLEHVNFPEKLLCKIRELLEEDGRAYVSTCVNAPAIDHVYHFKSIDEVREMLDSCGFEIEEEHVLPVENLPMETIVEKKITINYCVILRRKLT